MKYFCGNLRKGGILPLELAYCYEGLMATVQFEGPATGQIPQI